MNFENSNEENTNYPNDQIDNDNANFPIASQTNNPR